MKNAESLANHLPYPIAVVTQNGDLVDANRAFYELAEQAHVMALPAELFGAAFTRVLARAWIERHIQSTLPLIAGGEPRPTFRVSFMSTGEEKSLGVTFQEITAELELRRLLSERDEDFAVLRDVGVAMSSQLEIDSLAERTYEATQRVIPCNSVYVAVYDRDHNTISFPRYMEQGEWKQETSRSFANGLTEYLLRTGKPLLLNDDVLERAKELGITPVGRGCQAWIGAPMLVDGGAVGVIGLQDYEKSGVFDQHDMEMLTLIASQAAAGIKHALAVTAERRAFKESAEAQRRMLETERLRGVTETVGALNHEVNNPLAAIVGNSQLLLRKPADLSHGMVQKVEAILEAAKRIQRVTTKMASLISACSMPYPGQQSILDVHNSVAGEESEPPTAEVEDTDDHVVAEVEDTDDVMIAEDIEIESGEPELGELETASSELEFEGSRSVLSRGDAETEESEDEEAETDAIALRSLDEENASRDSSLGLVSHLSESVTQSPGTPLSSRRGVTPSRPAPPKPGTPTPSRPEPPTGSRPMQPTGSRPMQPTGSRPIQPTGSRPIQPAGSRPIQPAGSRPIQPAGSRPTAPIAPRPPAPVASHPPAPVASRPPMPAPSRPGPQPSRPVPPPSRPAAPPSRPMAPVARHGSPITTIPAPTAPKPAPPANAPTPSRQMPPAGSRPPAPAPSHPTPPAAPRPPAPAPARPAPPAAQRPPAPVRIAPPVGSRPPAPPRPGPPAAQRPPAPARPSTPAAPRPTTPAPPRPGPPKPHGPSRPNGNKRPR